MNGDGGSVGREWHFNVWWADLNEDWLSNPRTYVEETEGGFRIAFASFLDLVGGGLVEKFYAYEAVERPLARLKERERQ